MSLAYKVLTPLETAYLIAQNIVTGSELDKADGYIHLSTAEQLAETLHKHFPGNRDLSIAVIDLAALGDKVRWEAARDGSLFPHVYGEIPPSAVVTLGPLVWNADGSVKLPARTPAPS